MPEVDDYPGDPLLDLIDFVRAGTPPSAAWLARWSRDGREPLAAAWEVTDSPDAMCEVLVAVEGVQGPRVLTITDPDFGILGGEEEALSGEDMAEYVREKIRMPPTLAELLAVLRITP